MPDVKCRNCGEIYLETTESYAPGKTSNGAMFRFKDKYGPNGYNWSCFPFLDEIIGDALECPGCGVPMVDLSSIVLVDVPVVRDEGTSSNGELRETPPDDPECPKCYLKKETKELQQEVKPDVFECPKCYRGFKSEARYVEHMEKRHKLVKKSTFV